ncbi:MAG: hypothetical protein DWQ05_06015 [Calditrichaeota bacterium]|nr:MAG: hypothetical protein DWQ05_06015 [Calditrichota bacterium]
MGRANKLEILLTGGESGQVFCFETPTINTTLQHWAAYRQNIRNTGSWFGLRQSKSFRMIPQNLQMDQVLCREDIRFKIYNPNSVENPVRLLRTDVPGEHQPVSLMP